MKHLTGPLLVAFLILLGGVIASPAHAEWSPPKQQTNHRPCPPGYWESHKKPPCGWGSVPSLIHRVFRSAHGPRAYCIARRESGLRPWAYNRSSGAAGLFQFLPMWWRGKANPFNPVWNVLRAYSASHGGTYWGPWYPLGGC